MAIVRRRREQRGDEFLALVRRSVYGHAASPYGWLLRRAGCEYGDLERLVRRDGPEGALGALQRAGVYLTVDEFKGHRPTVRGADTLAIEPSMLRNPLVAGYVIAQSGGSRGPRTPVSTGLTWVADEAVNRGLAVRARGAGPWRVAHWDVPGGTFHPLLAYARAGLPPVRWFSPVDVGDPGLAPAYRWSARVMHWAGRLAGVPLPRPCHVPVDRPAAILGWITETLRTGAVPLLLAYSSPAVRLCQAALEKGVDLRGAHLRVYGEPITDARVAVIRRAGAVPWPAYVATESGCMAEGCLAPEAPDDVHLFDDLLALIQPGPDGAGPGCPADALLVSSIRRSAPLMLLNVSLGDRAVVRRRACGCPLEALGWSTHLEVIRSFQKLTAGGMTFLDTDLVKVLEEILPARFGGAATHYQLLEEEMSNGRPRVRLLVHPAVGAVDTEAVRRAFLDAIGAGSGAERIMAIVWRDADLLRVERCPPLATGSGKILHLHRLPAGRGIGELRGS